MCTNNIEIIRRIEALETRLNEDISMRTKITEMKTELELLRTQNKEHKTILKGTNPFRSVKNRCWFG